MSINDAGFTTMTDYNRSERNQRYESRLLAEGYRRIAGWVPGTAVDELRRVYPTDRGGIDWMAVIKAALASHKTDQGQPTE